MEADAKPRCTRADQRRRSTASGVLRSSAALVICAVVAGCAAQSSGRTTPRNRGWVLVEPAGQGFVVEMPQKPEVSESKQKHRLGSVERTVYHTTGDNGQLDYYLIRTVYPKGTFDGTGYTHEQALSDLRREFVESRKGGEVEGNWFMGMKKADAATMFTFRTSDDVFWRVRQAARGEVIYQIAYSTANKNLREKGAHYLRSFAFY